MQDEISRGKFDEETVDLLDLFRTILKHYKIILLVTILFGVGAFLLSKNFIVPTYSSVAKLYVLSKSTSITSLADIQMGTNLTNDYMEVVSGRPVLDQVIKNLELDEDYSSLYEKVSLKNNSNTRILQITVTDTDPERAKVIVDEIAEVSAAFISEMMDQAPPSIIQYGYVNYKKDGPNNTKNAILGAVVGALVSITIIVLLYFINDTVTTAEDVERKLGLKLIAQIPLDEEYDKRSGKRKKSEKSRNR